jgi:hypothetical protein
MQASNSTNRGGGESHPSDRRPRMKANRVGAHVRRLAFLGRKQAWQRMIELFSSTGEKRVTMVCGVQRSGTNMLMKILERSIETEVYHESDRRAFATHQMRPPSTIRGLIEKSPARRIVIKALCEGDKVSELLDVFAPANAIWMVRRYEDVINSNMKLWPGGRNQLDKIVFDRNAGAWRGRGMTDETHALIRRHYRPEMNDASALALFWYYRNQLLFDQRLDEDPRFLVLRYESLVQDPEGYGALIARFAGVGFMPSMVNFVFSDSVRKRPSPGIDPPIRSLCDGMLDRLTRLSQRDETLREPERHAEPASAALPG